jgi:hypothetical protein
MPVSRWPIRLAQGAATMALLAALLPTATAAAASPTVITTTRTVTKLDTASCSWWIASLKAIDRDPTYGPKLHQTVSESTLAAALSSNQCTLVASETVATSNTSTRASSLSGSAAAATGTVQGFWNSWSMYMGPLNAMQWHVNVGIVWSSSTSYTYNWRVNPQAWGPDCYLTTIPGYTGGYDSGGWCGVYNPQVAWTAMPGSNFYVSPAPLPLSLQKRWGWMRYYAYSNGSKSSAWGALN